MTTLLRAYPLPFLTRVVLFPSLVYDLQFASNLSLSLLPDLPKIGNHQKGEPNGAPLQCSDGRLWSCNLEERAAWVVLEVCQSHDSTGGIV